MKRCGVTALVRAEALTSVLRYDHETQHAFVGDYSGQITLLKLEKQTYSTITTLKGHEGNEATCGSCFSARENVSDQIFLSCTKPL